MMTLHRCELTDVSGANLEHPVASNLPGATCASLYDASLSSGFSVSAGRRNPLTVPGFKGSQVQILSSRRH